MAGLSAAALLARDGYRVELLEASDVAGGSSSSYKRKGYVFESGATTLMGFDEHQPLNRLEQMLGVELPKRRINPAMQVRLNGKVITRHEDLKQWIDEAAYHFGKPRRQRLFWKLAYRTAKLVWKVAQRNRYFPPVRPKDWLYLFTRNNPLDAIYLPLALVSVGRIMKWLSIDSPEFRAFVDEQLMITAQSHSADTPFMFGATALTYTNFSNYYVPGGLINMVRALEKSITNNEGRIRTKSKATALKRHIASSGEQGYKVSVAPRNKPGYELTAPVVVGNLPVWNMAELAADEDIENFFAAYGQRFSFGWGALTLGIGTDDVWPEGYPLHHQLHMDGRQLPEGISSRSLFVSMSAKGDTDRAPDGQRVLNISTHTRPDYWFKFPDSNSYEERKKSIENFILHQLTNQFTYFSQTCIHTVFTGTPVTWQNWIYRSRGRVGGLPQSMERSLLDWVPSETPFSGLYMCGDTNFPGQGIPGVTLSGINVYYRIKRNHKTYSF